MHWWDVKERDEVFGLYYGKCVLDNNYCVTCIVSCLEEVCKFVERPVHAKEGFFVHNVSYHVVLTIVSNVCEHWLCISWYLIRCETTYWSSV